MTLVNLPLLLVGLVFLGGCCFPMQRVHSAPPRHHAGAPTEAQPDGNDADAPQEDITQEQPPAAPAQPHSQIPK